MYIDHLSPLLSMSSGCLFWLNVSKKENTRGQAQMLSHQHERQDGAAVSATRKCCSNLEDPLSTDGLLQPKLYADAKEKAETEESKGTLNIKYIQQKNEHIFLNLEFL